MWYFNLAIYSCTTILTPEDIGDLYLLLIPDLIDLADLCHYKVKMQTEAVLQNFVKFSEDRETGK